MINISWATSGEHLGIREALIAASEADIAVVTSAGNYSPGETQIADRTHYPSQYCMLPTDTDDDAAARRKIPRLCSVAAVNVARKRASYSYYGAHAVSFAAPGGESGAQGNAVFLTSTPDSYAYGYGTSYSAPHVTGLIALLLSLDQSLPTQDCVDLLTVSATTIDADPAGALGSGLVNAEAALAALQKRQSGGGGQSGSNKDTPDANAAPVNINAASVAQLATLPQLGAWSAAAIVAYRVEHGQYPNVEALVLSGAVDPWTVQLIRDLVVAGAPGDAPPGPTPSEPPKPVPPTDTALTDLTKVDINTATAPELEHLPALGAWSAQRIIAHREDHGPFANVASLASTGAIDSWTLSQISHLLVAT